MAMNIKNPETERLAHELAKVTGESLTAAITEALRERLARERKRRGDPDFVERWVAIGKECAPLWKEPYRSTEHGDLLYDEKGLPK
jgi:antitoxin VapB